MNVDVRYVDHHHFIGTDDKQHHVSFDSRSDAPPAGPTPVSAILQALAACTGIDVVDILHKKRKTITALQIHGSGERATEHPKIFTKAHLHFHLTSPDSSIADLERSVQLSQEKYCSIAAMFRLSGCEITTSAELTTA